MDWSDGHYELTALALEPASRVAVDAIGANPGMTVLDLGTGTGNAALEAARLGARVLAVDPAPRLLEIAAQRAAEAGLSIETKSGVAGAIPAGDAEFDAVLSVFAVIFAPDPGAVAAELARVLRPSGRIALTAWLPVGPLFEAGRILREAMQRILPQEPARSSPRWGDPSWVRELFAAHDCYVEYTEHELVFDAPSANSWFEEQETHHPMWRAVKAALPADAWERVRRESVDALQGAAKEGVFSGIRSPYLLYIIAKA